jgi:peptide/nickel transport system substrate-binding protein
VTQGQIAIAQARLVLEDPHNCTDMDDALSVLDAIYDAPVRRDGPGFVPALATAWEVGEAGRVWTLTLREGVRFHDGTPCDAAAVAANLSRMARPDMGQTLGAPGVYAQYLGGAEIAATGPLAVRIALAEPMADLLDILVSAHVAAPSCLDDPVARPIGTGPYAVERIEADRIVARANPDHFDGPPTFARVTWRHVPEAEARRAAWREGAVQVANRLPLDGAAGAEERDYMSPTTIIYLFNVAGPLAESRVRRALNLALDRAALVRDVLGGAGVPLHGPFSPVHAGFVAGAGAPDPDAARALLAEAGHGGGLSLGLDCPTSLPDEAETLSAAVAAQLAPLGVTFDIRLVPDRTEYAHRVRRSEIRDLCVFDSSPLSTYRVLREKIDSRTRGSWWLGYGNAEVEALIDRAACTPDDGARHALFRQAHEVLRQDPPWLFCYCHRRRVAVRGAPADWEMRRDGVLDVRRLPAGAAR